MAGLVGGLLPSPTGGSGAHALADFAAARPELPEAIKAGILAMVKASHPDTRPPGADRAAIPPLDSRAGISIWTSVHIDSGIP
jgi:hypothetical protein